MMNSNRSFALTVLTGPSGVGKGSLVKKLLAKHPEIWLSISATTRQPRDGEIEGENYFFLDKPQFEKLIENGGFLEWAEFAGNFYGTPSRQVKENLDMGRPVLLEIELEGARQVKKNFSSKSELIFLAPPSLDELEKRIRGRASDCESAIRLRLERAKEEMEAQAEFDRIIINDDLDQTLLDLERIMGFKN